MKAAVTVQKNHEFRRIYRRGKTAVGPGLVIYCQKNREGLSRLGITVSTKLGKAVVRNRVRRQIREIYRLNRPTMKAGWDVIVVARMRAVNMGYWKLNQIYLHLLEQVDLLEKTI